MTSIFQTTHIHTYTHTPRKKNLKTHIYIYAEKKNTKWNPKPLQHTHTTYQISKTNEDKSRVMQAHSKKTANTSEFKFHLIPH